MKSRLPDYDDDPNVTGNPHARIAADYQDTGQFAAAAKECAAVIRASAELERNGVPGLDASTLAVTYVTWV